ncbi:VanZ like family protein [Desulfonispora thiosulfatigenes DSM 11270]|uniref:VanZ like family protein n=1 Tax=Desulfonispora thiosulfatigenes DSM 11270 TaxID=656914 RepID=A0A1W1V6L9_DESTI|nr:VanZ family protein [Desulfonispora thiosulfatigenes]SMB88963.1 VanZ like family protein [Desulfonispora thiosulfatigenes DSM 11270]
MSFQKIIAWVLVVIWMGVIFSFSAQVANKSNQLSTGITEIIAKTVQKVVPQADLKIKNINHLIRKNAHFFVYLVLGLLVAYALKTLGVHGFKAFFIGLVFCIIYAILDELHQMYVPGRGPGLKDVLIDSAGASVGICTFMIIYYLLKKQI